MRRRPGGPGRCLTLPGRARGAAHVGYASFVLARAGLLGPGSLGALARSGADLVRAGLNPAGAYAFGAARFGDRPAVVDDRGSLTFTEMHRRAESLAGSFSASGIGAQDRVGILCRNHHLFVEAVVALSRLGSDIVLVNTSFARPQLVDALRGHHIRHLVLDEEFVSTVRGVKVGGAGVTRFAAWTGGRHGSIPAVDDLDATSPPPLPPSPRPGSRYILLTSGTTGSPRSVERPVPLSLEPVVSVLGRVPLRVGDTVLIATPLFHALGFGHLGLSMLLSSTVVLQRAFDPEAVLAAVHRHRVRVLVAVPPMLKRLAELPEVDRRRYDTSSLEVVISSGSALTGELAARFSSVYGDHLYNVYGSTEAGWATIAVPEDLRVAPGTVGRPTSGTRVRVLDARGLDAPPGTVGVVAVRGRLSVPLGSSPEEGFVRTGDLGHFDRRGLLFVEGREDDMVVSGGENVYPQPVEEALLAHPAIEDAAVVAAPDADLGQRLRAYVVLGEGRPQLTVEQVRRFLRSRLPRYAVPKEIVFVDELPHNELGKTLHAQLRPGASGARRPR